MLRVLDNTYFKKQDNVIRIGLFLEDFGQFLENVSKRCDKTKCRFACISIERQRKLLTPFPVPDCARLLHRELQSSCQKRKQRVRINRQRESCQRPVSCVAEAEPIAARSTTNVTAC